MKTAEYFNIRGIGNLDLAKVKSKGDYINIRRSVFVDTTAKRRYKDKPAGRRIRRRDKKLMKIYLGLNLPPRTFDMTILVRELIMINEEERVSIFRTLRLDSSGATMTVPYGDRIPSKFRQKYLNFFIVLKEVLKAQRMDCIIDCNNPDYIEITATLPNQTFNYPARFVLDVALMTDFKLNGERPQKPNTT